MSKIQCNYRICTTEVTYSNFMQRSIWAPAGFCQHRHKLRHTGTFPLFEITYEVILITDKMLFAELLKMQLLRANYLAAPSSHGLSLYNTDK